MDLQIHCMETEAYGAVLRAFIAQSEVLSWGKEVFITDLRKELRVSDVEHREILGKLNLDDSIKSIREQRKSIDGQQLTATNLSVSTPMFEDHPSRKKLKPAQTPVSPSPKYSLHPQTSPMHARDERLNGNKAVFSPQMHARRHVIPLPQKREASSSRKVGVSVTGKKGFVRSGFQNVKPGSDIHAMDKHSNEDEKTFEGVNHCLRQIEREGENLALREHERGIMDPIEKLTELSDDGDSLGHRQKQNRYCNVERGRNIQ